MLKQIKYLDDLHVKAIEHEEPPYEIENLGKESLTVLEEKLFVLSKFSPFGCFKVDDLERWADEALDAMGEEDSEENILKKHVKRHDRKNEAFEKETFDLMEDYVDSDAENEIEQETNKTKDTKQKMWRSCTNGFFKRRDRDNISSLSNLNKTTSYDDSDSVFRSSLTGFFTGKNKTKSSDNTFAGASNSTRETNEYSSLVENNDKALAGNPIKALKHKRK